MFEPCKERLFTVCQTSSMQQQALVTYNGEMQLLWLALALHSALAVTNEDLFSYRHVSVPNTPVDF